jgi:predicted DNA binding protein
VCECPEGFREYNPNVVYRPDETWDGLESEILSGKKLGELASEKESTDQEEVDRQSASLMKDVSHVINSCCDSSNESFAPCDWFTYHGTYFGPLLRRKGHVPF